jgi:hypothetical protein
LNFFSAKRDHVGCGASREAAAWSHLPLSMPIFDTFLLWWAL